MLEEEQDGEMVIDTTEPGLIEMPDFTAHRIDDMKNKIISGKLEEQLKEKLLVHESKIENWRAQIQDIEKEIHENSHRDLFVLAELPNRRKMIAKLTEKIETREAKIREISKEHRAKIASKSGIKYDDLLGKEQEVKTLSTEIDLPEAVTEQHEYYLLDEERHFVVEKDIYQRLFPHQREAMKWLYGLHKNGNGGLLADEMGLGKTTTTIAFLSSLMASADYEKEARGVLSNSWASSKVLILAPATVLRQWQREFATWIPALQDRVYILHDNDMKVRTKILRNCDQYERVVVLTTYELFKRLGKRLALRHWDYFILDEGHKIKNPTTAISEAVREVATKHKIILSGTPMQNNLKELWSLFDFINPGKLGELDVFEDEFASKIMAGGYTRASELEIETAYQLSCELRSLIKPYIMRRVKEDLDLSLPSKCEQVLMCKITPVQYRMYCEYLSSGMIKKVLERTVDSFAAISALRKICNHPYLLQSSQDRDSLSQVFEERALTMMGKEPEQDISKINFMDSGKMIVLDKVLKVWHHNNNKVLVFSQSRKMLDVIEKFVLQKEYSYRRLDGGLSVNARMPIVDEFNDPAKGIFVLLMTTRVGGLGLNLMGADRIVIFDPDWNPMVDMQAAERAFRIGQDKAVSIYRFVLDDTIEERIYHRQVFKQYLADRILLDPDQKRFFQASDLHELFAKPPDPESSKTPSSDVSPKKSKMRKSSSSSSKKAKKKQKVSRDAGTLDLSDVGLRSKTMEEIQEEEIDRVFEDREKSSRVFGKDMTKSHLKRKIANSEEKKKPQRSEKKILESLLTSQDLREVFDNDRATTVNLSTRIESIKLDNHVSKLVSVATENLKRSRQAVQGTGLELPGMATSILHQSDTQGQFGRSLTLPASTLSSGNSSFALLENLAKSIEEGKSGRTNHNIFGGERDGDNGTDEMDGQESSSSSSEDENDEDEEADGDRRRSAKKKRKVYSKSRSALIAKRISGELREFLSNKPSGAASNRELEEEFGHNKNSDFCQHEMIFLKVLQTIADCRKISRTEHGRTYSSSSGQYEWRIKSDYL